MENYISISELKQKSVDNLTQIAKELSVEGPGGMRKQELVAMVVVHGDSLPQTGEFCPFPIAPPFP